MICLGEICQWLAYPNPVAVTVLSGAEKDQRLSQDPPWLQLVEWTILKNSPLAHDCPYCFEQQAHVPEEQLSNCSISWCAIGPFSLKSCDQ